MHVFFKSSISIRFDAGAYLQKNYDNYVIHCTDLTVQLMVRQRVLRQFGFFFRRFSLAPVVIGGVVIGLIVGDFGLPHYDVLDSAVQWHHKVRSVQHLSALAHPVEVQRLDAVIDSIELRVVDSNHGGLGRSFHRTDGAAQHHPRIQDHVIAATVVPEIERRNFDWVILALLAT